MRSEITTKSQMPKEALEDGDFLMMTSADNRWYMRLWHFITFRSPPIIEERYKISGISESGTTIEIDHCFYGDEVEEQ